MARPYENSSSRLAVSASRGRHRPAIAVVALLALMFLTSMGSDAQQTGSTDGSVPMRIMAPATLPSNGAKQIGLGITVSPADRLPQNSFVRIRGLPDAASLSEGYAVAMGTWAVSFQALPALRANLPSDLSGRATLTIQLVSIDGIVLAETSTTLVMEVARTPEPPRAAERQAEPPRPAEPPARPRLSPDDRQRAEKLLAQGEKYLESGNVAIARQFFERATDVGLAIAALRLAATFDPNELTRIGAKGVVPSPAEARKWYERAKLLGAPEADERLARLTN